MKTAIFEYQSYKTYLKDWVHGQPSQGYGARGRMAKAMGCQTAFVSQVLRGDHHLSLEQAEALSQLLELSESEEEYFLLLVQENRAGTHSLQQKLKKQIHHLQEKHRQLHNRLKSNLELSQEDHSIYFSSWIYASVNMIVAIPEFQTKKAICQALNLSQSKVNEVLEFLVTKGLVRQEGDRFSVGAIHLHLAHTSSMIAKHHTNWRMRAIQSLDNYLAEDLHYSAAVTLAKKDVEKIRKILLQSISDARRILDPSEPEELFALNVDFFKI